MNITPLLPRALATGALAALLFLPVAAQTSVAPVDNPCPRPDAGTTVLDAPDLFSTNGVLSVQFSYQHRFDADGRELFCFMTPDGLQNPTLHLNPGDHLAITVTNNLPGGTQPMVLNAPTCGATVMNSTSVNIHYHGTNTAATCHQDEVIKTIINSGDTFNYDVAFPASQPPGLYFYHPHVHGLTEHAVQGGATGAIVIEGISNVQAAVSGLPQRILMIRDQSVPDGRTPGGNIPDWDLTMNYVPIASPARPTATDFVPAVLQMPAGDQEFWRICNSASDTVLDLEYLFDGAPQVMQVVSIDGVPVNSQDGTQPGTLIPVTHFLLPTASRVEVIVSAPPPSVKVAQLITLAVDTGPDGDNDPQRPLATIQTTEALKANHVASIAHATAAAGTATHVAGLAAAPIAVRRVVFFDEINTADRFFMAVEGQPEHVFDPNGGPDIVATQGTVEEWTVENRTREVHEFHLHSLHFLVESQNYFEINGASPAAVDNGQYLDLIHVPCWDGRPLHPFPSVTILVDFRNADIGDVLFHCHILEHADLGMMAMVRVRPAVNPQSK